METVNNGFFNAKNVHDGGETFFISERNLDIEGADFTGNLYARKMHADGRPYHTFRTSTVLCDGTNVRFRDCTFANDAGPGRKVGQAIALYLDGDGISLENCRIYGHQDTLFLAPLPLKEHEKDGFLGPKQFEPRTNRVFHFKNCLITGGVDFIFGGAEAYFDDCEFRSVEPGYIFAPCTPEGRMGFTARNCCFTAEKGVPAGSCYIGRPWREHACVRLENCFLGEHISKAGWKIWSEDYPIDGVRFSEAGSFGPGADNSLRPSWVKVE